MSLSETIDETVDFIQKESFKEGVDAGVILGSGLGSFADKIEEQKTISYQKIPNFPVSTVQGHAGELILGKIRDKKVIAFSGRFHRYEGFSLEQIHTPVTIAQALNANKLIISNAAGAVNRSFKVGDFIIIESVLRQTLPISARSHKKYRYEHEKTARQAEQLAVKNDFDVQMGNYLYSTGPNYETKAEIRAFRKMGADMVGMSTASELFETARLKLKTAAISLITNMAAGIGNEKLDHREVKMAAEEKQDEFSELVKLLIKEL